MSTLTFQDLDFEQIGDNVRFIFLDNFYFDIPVSELDNMGSFTLGSHKIEFPDLDEDTARNKLNILLDKGFEHLFMKTTKNPTTFVHKALGLPLIGNAAFGITDRNSSMLEIKPVTGCNMNCIFCSVDEGLTTHKKAELVIDADYLAAEANKIIDFKACPVQIVINAHGEPTLYKPMPELISKLAANPLVENISMITNGTLLTEEYLDKLAQSGLSQLNLSLNAISDKAAKILEGHGKYSIDHVKKMAKYATTKMDLYISPVYVPGYNDDELSLIIEFAKEIGAKVGIQNFLEYKRGRKPKTVKQRPWPEFFDMLKKLEKKHDFKLMLDESDFKITKTKHLPKPFKAGNVVDAKLICRSRYPKEYIAATKDRNITVNSDKDLKLNTPVRLKITSDKHNLFFGKLI